MISIRHRFQSAVHYNGNVGVQEQAHDVQKAAPNS